MEQEFLASGGEWKEFLISDLFYKKTMKGFPKSVENLAENSNGFHVFGQNIKYQCPQKILLDEKYLHIVEPNKPILAYTSSVGEIGMIEESFYRSGDNGAFQGVFPKFENYNKKHILFLLTILQKHFSEFGYGTGMANVMDLIIPVPFQNNNLALDFMENFISELQASRLRELQNYLKATGLSDYKLTVEEMQAVETLGTVEWTEFELGSLFGSIQQGERLTKSAQIAGSLPFVMSGVTDTGVVKYIGNSVTKFPKNSLTIDIFGNVFYRNFEFGASDDVGVYWNAENTYNKEAMLILAGSISRALAGKFDYGYKLRSSRSHNLTCHLPILNGNPDFDLMATLGKAIEKLVISDVVKYAEREEQGYRKVITQ